MKSTNSRGLGRGSIDVARGKKASTRNKAALPGKRKQAKFKRVAPVYQPAPLVLAALHNLSKRGEYERHLSFSTACIGHLVGCSPAAVSEVYNCALSIAWGAESIEGLESVILTGLANAYQEGDLSGAELGRTTLQAFPVPKKARTRPVFFFDRKTSMLTVLSPDEFAQARIDILNTPNAWHTTWGIGYTVRNFNQPSRADTGSATAQKNDGTRPFDQGTCRAWVEGIGIVAGVGLMVFGPELAVGGLLANAVGPVSFLSNAWKAWRAAKLATVMVGVGAGSGASKVVSPAICSGLAALLGPKAQGGGGRGTGPGTSGPGGGTQGGSAGGAPRVNPNDLGFSPRDFGAGPSDQPERPPQDDGKPQVPVNGTVEEGEGFTAIQINGTASVTMTGQDGSQTTVTMDKDGNATVTNTDKDGNTTVESYDSGGNSTSGDVGGAPPKTDGYPVPEDGDGGGSPKKPGDAGMPVPDSETKGPWGPAAIRADLVAQPTPDGDGPIGPKSLQGRGTTFLLSGLRADGLA